MNKKSKFVFFTFMILLALLFAETSYIYSSKSMTYEMKKSKENFVNLVGLPDLAISTEASFVRHRSLASMDSIFKDDGSLREYFVSTYAFSHSHIINKKEIR